MSSVSKLPHPPFPLDVPVAPLNRHSLQKLLSGDATESEAMFESCKTLGFFLLDLRDSSEGAEILNDVDGMFEVGKNLFDMELEKKSKFAMKEGTAFGYKGVGISKVDHKGTPDRCEFYGISKDDVIGSKASFQAPDVLTDQHSLLQRFSQRAHAISLCIISHLNDRLHLPNNKLGSLHRLSYASADQIRFLKMAPQPEADRRTSLLAHTDFGSVTLVWNLLGGLQILPPGSTDYENGWQFVKPQPGCAIVNMGDAMVRFSDGIVRSNLHRVAYAPGEQALCDRYSLAYFTRPEDDVVMEPLVSAGETREKGEKRFTSKEWVAIRTALYRKGGEVMRSSGGREDPDVRFNSKVETAALRGIK